MKEEYEKRLYMRREMGAKIRVLIEKIGKWMDLGNN